MNDKSNPIFGLFKIPDSILLVRSNIEIGKLKSYIEELEYKLCLRKAITKGSIESLIIANDVLRKKNKELNMIIHNKNTFKI